MRFGLIPKMLAALGALALFAHAGDYSSWARYRPVTLSTVGLGLTGPVTNFPILVRFKASTHKDMLDSAATQVQADGSDIRVTLADGSTDVPFEIEHLSTGPNGRLHLWILADNVPANDPAAASFRVYWGKTGETSMSNPAATFPTAAGYQAVFHLNDTGTTGATIFNSANPALNGTATGTAITTGQAAGQGFVSAKGGLRVRRFGNSQNGVDNSTEATDYIQFSPGAGHILSTHTGPLTFEAWIYSSIVNSGNTSPGTKHIIAHGDGNTGGKAWFARTSDLEGGGAQNHYSAGGPNNINGPIAPFGEQHHWQFVTAVWDGTNWAIYRQRENDFWNIPTVAGPTGMTPDSATYKIIPGTAPAASTLPWFIGGASDSTGANVTRGWQGWMDEVRISTVARDSNYVKLTFFTSRADTLASVTHPVSIGGTEAPGAGGAYAAWSGHRSIKLNTSATGANVSGDVHDFPVLIRLGQAEASIIAAANGGNSIRFSKADDQTPLPYEIEHWSANSAAIWVKVDTIKGNNASQYIRMHWGNPSATSESDGKAVFDTANGYVSVWHMNGTTDETASTAHGFVATQFNNPGVNASAAIGPGRTFDGTQYFQVLNSANSAMNFASTDTYTLSAWVRSDSVVATGNNTGHLIVSKGDHQWVLAVFGSTAPNRYYEITTKVGNNGWRQTTTAPTTTPAYAGDTANTKIGVWRYVTGTWDGTTLSSATGRIYMDGVLHKTSVFNAGNDPDAGRQTARDVHIGVLSNEGTGSTNPTGTLQRYWVGSLDEIRISKVLRDSNWIKLEYENQKAVNSLVDIGIPLYTVPGAPTNVVATPIISGATITWSAPADNGGTPILSYKATVVGDTLLACETTTLSCTINELASGENYNVVVRAINAVGAGPASAASNIFTPIAPAAPGAPQSPVATVLGPTSISVSWTAPASDGGSPITSYTVTGNPAGSCFTSGELTCTVNNLTPGTTYSFTVTASNIAGSSPASTPVSATTTGILPGSFLIHMDGARNPYTYRLPAASISSVEKLSMTITNVQGKKIWSRTINPAATKVGEITWDGNSSHGQPVAPGMYVVHVKVVVDGQTLESIQKGVKH